MSALRPLVSATDDADANANSTDGTTALIAEEELRWVQHGSTFVLFAILVVPLIWTLATEGTPCSGWSQGIVFWILCLCFQIPFVVTAAPAYWFPDARAGSITAVRIATMVLGPFSLVVGCGYMADKFCTWERVCTPDAPPGTAPLPTEARALHGLLPFYSVAAGVAFLWSAALLFKTATRISQPIRNRALSSPDRPGSLA
ncbi:Hypothetical protein UVM_LOCUS221 [uncultured virus]|nr:Hypothetical protein UVM_LOCUS221 [uncultured virus]